MAVVAPTRADDADRRAASYLAAVVRDRRRDAVRSHRCRRDRPDGHHRRRGDAEPHHYWLDVGQSRTVPCRDQRRMQVPDHEETCISRLAPASPLGVDLPPAVPGFMMTSCGDRWVRRSTTHPTKTNEGERMSRSRRRRLILAAGATVLASAISVSTATAQQPDPPDVAESSQDDNDSSIGAEGDAGKPGSDGSDVVDVGDEGPDTARLEAEANQLLENEQLAAIDAPDGEPVIPQSEPDRPDIADGSEPDPLAKRHRPRASRSRSRRRLRSTSRRRPGRRHRSTCRTPARSTPPACHRTSSSRSTRRPARGSSSCRPPRCGTRSVPST